MGDRGMTDIETAAFRRDYEAKRLMDDARRAIGALVTSSANARLRAGLVVELMSAMNELEHHSDHITRVWD